MSTAEWLAWREMCERQKNEFRPIYSMKSLPAPEGYSAEIFINKKLSTSTIACSVIINKATDQVILESGWASPNVAEKKLIEALAALSEVVKRRNTTKEKP